MAKSANLWKVKVSVASYALVIPSALALAGLAQAQTVPTNFGGQTSAPVSASGQGSARTTASPTTVVTEITVTAKLDVERDQIAPSLGAVTYTIGQNEIQSIGQGDNGSFQQISIQAPGAYQDEFGEVHVRGDHGDLQYRVNGVFLPEQLNGFGQEVDPRLISSVTLIDGALPAQFGDRTAGIFDITTKSGATLDGTDVSLYGGSRDTFNQAITTGATSGSFDYFVAASHDHNDLGIDNPISSPDAVHDGTDQERVFSYLSYRLNDSSRLTLLLNAAVSSFEIPDTPGLTPVFLLLGEPQADASAVNDSQLEQNYYSVLSYQTSFKDLKAQVSVYTRYTNIYFTPDPVQDLLFDGVAARVKNTDLANGAQVEASYTLGPAHTLRFGGLLNYDSEELLTRASTFPSSSPFMPDATASQQSSSTPINVAELDRNSGVTTGLYLQDEWQLNRGLILNYGARVDLYDTNFDREGQFSPRVNLVWTIDPSTTAHAGYARYFTPPTLQYISAGTIVNFEHTTDAPFNAVDGPQKAERSNYLDAGLSRQFTRALKIDVDAFAKFATNLLDDGQFGNAVILNNFNYETGTIYGAELSSIYKQGPVSLYANFSYVQTEAKDVDSSQYEFPSDELTYIATHDIQLDHQQRYSVSAGGSYTIHEDWRVYGSFLYGDGLRAGFANLQKLPSYHPLNIGLERTLPLEAGHLKIRFDVINLFDEVYELRNGSGLGIAAPAYGPRRALYGGVSYSFR